ncbi:MAG: flavin reductase family protein [Leucobacter sp.]
MPNSSLTEVIPISSLLKLAFRNHPGGVAVITAKSKQGNVALTATSVTSVNAEPPLLAFSVSALSSSSPKIQTVDHVVVHLLDAGGIEIAKIGATSRIDRFADTSLWSELETGEPVFHVARAWLRCRLIERIDASGSTLYLAEVVEASILDDEAAQEAGDGLVYVNRTWHRLNEDSRID